MTLYTVLKTDIVNILTIRIWKYIFKKFKNEAAKSPKIQAIFYQIARYFFEF